MERHKRRVKFIVAFHIITHTQFDYKLIGTYSHISVYLLYCVLIKKNRAYINTSHSDFSLMDNSDFIAFSHTPNGLAQKEKEEDQRTKASWQASNKMKNP